MATMNSEMKGEGTKISAIQTTVQIANLVMLTSNQPLGMIDQENRQAAEDAEKTMRWTDH